MKDDRLYLGRVREAAQRIVLFSRDTTVRSAESPHDVHRVTCSDCHPEGAPRPRAGSRQ